MMLCFLVHNRVILAGCIGRGESSWNGPRPYSLLGQVQALPYFISGIGTFHNWQCLARLVSSSNSISSDQWVLNTVYNSGKIKSEINPFPLSI